MFNRLGSMWDRWMRELRNEAEARNEDTLDRAALRNHLYKPFWQFTFRRFWQYFLPPLHLVATALVFVPLRRSLRLPWTLAVLLTFALSGWMLSALLFLFSYDASFAVGEPALRTAGAFAFWGLLMVVEEGVVMRAFGPVRVNNYPEAWPIVKNLAYLLAGLTVLII